MHRPTIRELANAAGVSTATVNRVLAGSANVKLGTTQRVKNAARDLGFTGLQAGQGQVAAVKSRYKFGVLLPQASHSLYADMAGALQTAAELVVDAEIDVQIKITEDTSPQNIADNMLLLAENCNAIAVVSVTHPIVMQAVAALEERGIPIVALISQLSTTGQVRYVGLDNWKVGRTAAWFCEHVCKGGGNLGMLIGKPRFERHEVSESGFRSYLREFAPTSRLIEPLITFEDNAVAQEVTEKLVTENPDLRSIYVAGGGISGVLKGLCSTNMKGRVAVVGEELTDVTRNALLDGSMILVISHPLQRLAQQAIDTMIRATTANSKVENHTSIFAFDLFTSANI